MRNIRNGKCAKKKIFPGKPNGKCKGKTRNKLLYQVLLVVDDIRHFFDKDSIGFAHTNTSYEEKYEVDV